MSASVIEIRDRLRRREIRAESAVRDALSRIRAVDGELEATLQILEDSALAEAREIDRRLDAGEDPGPLAGVPYTAKDNICVAAPGARTTGASRILERHESPYDAGAVARLRAAGAICVAKTNHDEFGMGGSTENSGYHVTRNPWRSTLVPGGSSGGAAALCAATRGMLHIGSDTGGSIRQPASYCGVTGLKPSYGRVSRYGLLAFASSLDQIGPLAHSALECALALETIAGHDSMDATSSSHPVPDFVESARRDIAGLRIGIAPELWPEGVDGEVRARVEEALDELKRLGAEIHEVSLPHARYANQVYVLLSAAEASSNLARYDGVHYGHRAENPSDLVELYSRSRAEGFGAEVKRRILVGTFVLSSGYYDAFYRKALKVRQLLRRDFASAFAKVDVLACPTSPVPAFALGERIDDPLRIYALDVLTVPANLASLPAISFPAGFSSDGLPIGAQLIGRPMEDDVVLRLAHAFQTSTDHHRQAPPISARNEA